ncbi:MAG: phosphoribosylglycinamide formyltransferase [Bacteroidota bacterium]
MKHKIAILASGSGSNAEEIMKYFHDHAEIEVDALLTNNPNAYAIERAKKFGVLHKVFTKQDFETQNVVEWLRDNRRITHIALAGFLWLIPENLIKAYPNKIVNIHPALLPKYGGRGMYGMKVHEAVKASGDTLTGITIHLVNTRYDEGEILAQKSVEIESSDTAKDIADKVHELEHKYYPAVIESWIKA